MDALVRSQELVERAADAFDSVRVERLQQAGASDLQLAMAYAAVAQAEAALRAAEALERLVSLMEKEAQA